MKTMMIFSILATVIFGSTAVAADNAMEARDIISKYLDDAVINRKLVTKGVEPKVTDPKTGEVTVRSFAREAVYTAAKKTELGLSFEYHVSIDWQTHRVNEKGEPTGEALNPVTYSSKVLITVAALPGHRKLYGIWSPIEFVKNGKLNELKPTDFKRVVVYLDTDLKGATFLRLDGESLFPKAEVVGAGDKTTLMNWNWYETLKIENGKLHREQLWRDSLVDPQTLQSSRPMTEEREVYTDSEK